MHRMRIRCSKSKPAARITQNGVEIATLTANTLSAEDLDETTEYTFQVNAGDAAGHWLRGPGSAARRYLNNDEKEYFDQMLELGALKILIDRHYACQDLMKKWLLVHVPLSMAVILVSIWHFLLVNVYSL